MRDSRPLDIGLDVPQASSAVASASEARDAAGRRLQAMVELSAPRSWALPTPE
jgi:hypothetical protein